MLSEYAYAKFQSTDGEEYFVHTIPALLTSRKWKDNELGRQGSIEWLPITSIFSSFMIHAIIYYEND